MRIRPLGRRAAISLGGNSVILKKIRLTRQKDANFEEQVFYEAEQHLQQDISELYFRYHEIKSLSNPEEAHLLLVGARRETVEQRIALIRQTGMRIGVVDCDAFALSNMFEYDYGISDQLIGLVNIGAATTQISLIAGGENLFTREIPLAGASYTNRIAEELRVDLENAETLKITASMQEGSVPAQVVNLIKEINAQLINEIKVTIGYYFQSGEAAANITEASYIFLCGGSARLYGLDTSLAAELKIPVQSANPFQKVNVNPKKFDNDYLLNQGHLYGIAVGLGLRRMGDHNT